MNRRSFITRLASGIVGVSLVDVQWIPTPITGEIPASAPLTDIGAISAEFLRCLVGPNLWAPAVRGQFVPGDYVLGVNGFEHQLNISVDTSEINGKPIPVDAERHLMPAAEQMRYELLRRGIRRYGALPVPPSDRLEGAVATDEQSGVTVRGLRAFDPVGSGYEDEESGEFIVTRESGWLLRFDVLGSAA